MISWVFVGLLAAAALVASSETVRDLVKSVGNWLEKVAAEAVESIFGYEARQKMFRAISQIKRIAGGLVRNRSTVYTKKNRLDDTIVQTVVQTTIPEAKFDRGLLEDIRNNRANVLEYKPGF